MRKINLGILFFTLFILIVGHRSFASMQSPGNKIEADPRFQMAIERFRTLINTQDDNLVKRLTYGRDSDKFAIMSDFHLGNGRLADYFNKNKGIIEGVLNYYQQKNYHFILLGDFEDFHSFELKTIYEAHQNIYDSFKRYGLEKVFRVIGNHDIEWGWNDPLSEHIGPAREAVILTANRPEFDGPDIFLTHGQQAMDTIEEDLYAVREGKTIQKVWNSLFGKVRESMFTEAATGFDEKDAIYSRCADKLGKVIICGHTHFPIFSQQFPDVAVIQELANRTAGPACLREWLKATVLKIRNYISMRTSLIPGLRLSTSPDQILSKKYFNSGACCFVDGITLLEIEGRLIRLVFWYNGDKCMERPEIIFEGDIKYLTQ